VRPHRTDTIRTQRSEALKRSVAAADTWNVRQETVDPVPTGLESAYEQYRAAMRSWRAAAHAGDPACTERAADRLLHARVELYRHLVATGWTPPHAVEVQLDRDAALVAAPADFEALLSG
jgi:hypothetical protein